MNYNLEWLWIIHKQVAPDTDFITWFLQVYLVNREVYCTHEKPDQYHLPKEIAQNVLTSSYRYDIV